MSQLIILQNPPGYQDTCIIFPAAGTLANIKQAWIPFFPTDTRILCIEYPAREKAPQDLSRSFKELVWDIVSLISRYSSPRTYYIGESMGGYLAFETAKTLYLRLNQKIPKLLLISVAAANLIKNDLQFLINLPGNKFEKKILEKIFNSQNVWEKFDSETKDFLISLLRQDMKTLSSYDPKQTLQLPFSIMVANGFYDSYCHRQETENYWKYVGNKEFLYYTFDGGHILTPHNIAQVLDIFIHRHKASNQ